MHVYQFRRALSSARRGRPERPTLDDPVLCRLIFVFRMAEKADIGRSVLCRPISVVKISDIVKRKRIRLPEVGRRTSEDGSYPFSVLRPLSSVKQPVVGLEPDRSDPRMRLKQNWSFQRRRRRKSEDGNQKSEGFSDFRVLNSDFRIR